MMSKAKKDAHSDINDEPFDPELHDETHHEHPINVDGDDGIESGWAEEKTSRHKK